MDLGLDLAVPFFSGPLPAVRLSASDQQALTGALLLASAEAQACLGPITARIGLSRADLVALVRLLDCGIVVPLGLPDHEPDDEERSVLDLLEAERDSDSPAARFLPAILARRSMEPNHLWEDLGLAQRPDLTALMQRHFPGLAARNKGMRWKRFLYRALCESQGFVACAAPSCSACDEFLVCFGEETGESRLARLRREAELSTVTR
jgi:nitrogen fixation protein NifQ